MLCAADDRERASAKHVRFGEHVFLGKFAVFRQDWEF